VKLLRPLRRALRGACAGLAALGAALGLSGCLAGLQITSVTPGEVELPLANPEMRDLEVRYAPFRTNAPRLSLIPERPDRFLGLQDPSPNQQRIRTSVTLQSTTQPAPFRVRAEYRAFVGLDPDDFITTEVALSEPIYVRRAGAGPAPRLTALSPEAIRRPSTATVVIQGQHLAGLRQVQLLRAGTEIDEMIPPDQIVVREIRYDENTGTAQATLDVLPTAGLGQVDLRVETASAFSYVLPLTIVETPPPEITALYPSEVRLNVPETILVRGPLFFAGSEVRIDPPGPGAGTAAVVTPPGSTLRDAQTLTARVRGTTTGLVRVRVETLGGRAANTRPLLVNFQSDGLRIGRITPAQVVAGTQTQVMVELNGPVRPVNAVHLIPRSARGQAEIVPGTLPQATRQLVRLDVPDEAAGGVFDLALATTSGQTTNAVPIEVIAPPPDRPFVRRARYAQIAQGETTQREIVGERLSGALEVRFDPPVVTATIVPLGGPFPPVQTDTILTVQLAAAPAGEITGNVRTTFRVRTPAGWSNEADFTVTPDTGPPRRSYSPHLDRLFPNFVYPGPLKAHFIGLGELKGAPGPLVVAPAGVAREPSLRVLASHPHSELYALDMFVPEAAGATDTLMVSAMNGAGDATNPFPLRVLGPQERRGPEITGIEAFAPAFYSDTITQFRLLGRNFGSPEAMTLVFTDATGRPPGLVPGLKVFPSSGTRPDGLESVVVQFTTPPAAQDVTDLFAVAVDGLESGLAGEITRKVPPPTGPFIRSLSRGEIARPPIVSDGGLLSPGTILVAITGDRLENAERLEFDSAGLSAERFVPLNGEPNPSSNSFVVLITAAPDAELTGDALTTFRIVTTGNERSNTVGLIVKP
jgi:hypothetical protein